MKVLLDATVTGALSRVRRRCRSSTTRIESDVRRITGINADDLGSELMKFVNGQFWYRRHTGQPRFATCADVEALI